MRYDAVVFDNDGVIIEPPDYDAVRAAIREAFRDHGVDPDPDGVEAMLGTDVDRIVAVCSEHGIDPEPFWRTRETNSSRAQRERMRAGAVDPYDDVDAIDDLGRPVGIVSNNQQRTIDHVVDAFGLDVSVAYGREPTLDGLRRTKPDPHYLERALSDLGVEDALYVGDSNVDLAAADALGVDSAFLRRGHREGYDLVHEPTYEIRGLDALRGILDPPGQ